MNKYQGPFSIYPVDYKRTSVTSTAWLNTKQITMVDSNVSLISTEHSSVFWAICNMLITCQPQQWTRLVKVTTLSVPSLLVSQLLPVFVISSPASPYRVLSSLHTHAQKRHYWAKMFWYCLTTACPWMKMMPTVLQYTCFTDRQWRHQFCYLMKIRSNCYLISYLSVTTQEQKITFTSITWILAHWYGLYMGMSCRLCFLFNSPSKN